MKSLWQGGTREALSARMGQLTPDRRPEWGRMTAQQMVGHLILSVQMAIGEQIVRGYWTPLQLPLLKQFVLYCVPFPKNMPTAPELLVTSTPNPWIADVEALRATLGRFTARGRDARWPVHPMFGALSADDWGVLVYRHCDHHLRQFEV